MNNLNIEQAPLFLDSDGMAFAPAAATAAATATTTMVIGPAGVPKASFAALEAATGAWGVRVGGEA